MFDPVSTSGVEMVEYVKLFLDHLVPARFGLVLLPDHKNEAAVAVCQGFSYLSINLSPKEALRWLFKVCSECVRISSSLLGVLFFRLSNYFCRMEICLWIMC